MGNRPYKVSLVDILIVDSIPIVYYGQEQSLNGSGDPVRSFFDR